jgi:hypothetical protein
VVLLSIKSAWRADLLLSRKLAPDTVRDLNFHFLLIVPGRPYVATNANQRQPPA